jgi:filamentous hemagglutinin family protein
MPRFPPASPGVRRRRTSLLSSLVLLQALLAASQAQITLDGSLGPRGPLTGPNYRIDANAGQIRGSNLFHSFGQFNVRPGERATFTGPNTVANIVGRVTGGQASAIDGVLRSEIAGANLYLLNPSGVLFGPNAGLDVSGSFHVSTADFLRFTDGATFFADLGQESVLTVASPAAFGFLGQNSAAITIQGSTLRVPAGQDLSVVGGNIMMAGGRLEVVSGHIAVSTPTLTIDAGVIQAFAEQDSRGTAGSIDVNVSRLTLTNRAQISSSTRSTGRGPDVTVAATDTITITGHQSGVFSITQGRGPGGDLHVQAKTIELRDGGTISAISSAAGSVGGIRLQAGETFRSQDGTVTTTNRAGGVLIPGGGGAITLTAGRLIHLLDSEISTSVSGGGRNAGDLTLHAPFIVLNGSDITANAFGGQGGNLRLSTEVLLADPTSIVAASSTLGITSVLPPLSGALIPLPQTFVSAAALLPARCAARFSGGKASSLVLGGRGGLPADPSGVLPSPLIIEERLAADPAVTELRHQSPSNARFALLADREKALPRLGCPK